MLTDDDKKELTYARNRYENAAKECGGELSGPRFYGKQQADKILRRLLWKHRDALIEAAVATVQVQIMEPAE